VFITYPSDRVTLTSGVYSTFCFAHFAQAVCQDSSLWFFEQQLEASKAKTFAGETPSKSFRKTRKEAFFAQMFVLQHGQFASDSSF
jgi:hypothetical protein